MCEWLGSVLIVEADGVMLLFLLSMNCAFPAGKALANGDDHQG